MKTIMRNLVAAIFVATALQTHAQGFIYDQQSATGPVPIIGNGNADGLNIQEESPLTQSFIPMLLAIDFVQLEFVDIPNNGNKGATVYVNLWTGSSNPSFATFLGSSTQVYMPNGFVNNGLGSAGITNFFYLTPITLTAGQTYYLQPVVLSGDDPWDVITIGDTYSNGQVFEKGAGFNTDFWFREGLVTSVPEPFTLPLIGLSSFLFFVCKRRSKLVVPLLFIALILPVHAASDSVVQATADAAGLAPTTTLPSNGTYWVMRPSADGDLMESPYPFLALDLSALPIYSLTGDIFMVDDTGGQITSSTLRMSNAQAASMAEAQAQTVANLIQAILYPSTSGDISQGFQPNGFSMDLTNGLWLEASNEVSTLGLRLHNTVGGDNYQLLSASNLMSTNWDLGQILFYASDGYADFSPVPITNATAFYRAHQANPVMQIYNAQDSLEPDPTNSDPGQPGIIYIFNEGSATNDVTVYYHINGTAQNGVDYSNLTEVATISNGQSYVEIDIEPIANGLKPDQTVILTLLQNANYLIDTA